MKTLKKFFAGTLTCALLGLIAYAFIHTPWWVPAGAGALVIVAFAFALIYTVGDFVGFVFFDGKF
jgi:hypothetical protein